MASTCWLCVSESGEEVGPFDAPAMAARVVAGLATEETLVREASGAMKFRRLGTVRALIDALQAAKSMPSEAEPEVAPSSTTVELAANAGAWYYTDDGDCERGPLSLQQMRRVIADGFLVGPRPIRHNGETQDVSLWPQLDPDADEYDEVDAGDDGWEGDVAEWVFIDDDDNVQGPFSTAEMREWASMGHLEPTRRVSIAGGEPDDFRPLAEWVELNPHAAADTADTGADESVDASAGSDAGADAAGATPAAEEDAAIEARLALLRDERPAASASTTAPMTAAASSDEGSWLYIDDAGIEQGPFALTKLCGWVRRGLLRGDRMVRGTHTGGELRPLSTVPQLADALSAATAAATAATAAEASSTPAASVPASSASAAAAASVDCGNSTTAAEDAAMAAALWEYYDDRGKVQGPFSARKLLSWLKGGHLKPSRMARPYVGEGGAATAAASSGGSASGGAYTPLGEIPYFAAALKAGALPPAPPTAPSLGGGARGGTVETPMWYYADASGAEQGPFTAAQMQAWARHAYLPAATLVRHISETATRMRPLSTVPQLGGHVATPAAAVYAQQPDLAAHGLAEAVAADPVAALLAARGLAPTATLEYQDYKVVGGFAPVANGRFLNPETSGDNYWATKNIPKHRDERMMGHYFDLNAWQDEQNRRQAGGAKTIGVKKKRVV